MNKTHTPGPWKTRKGFSTGTIEIFAPNPKIKKPYYPTELAEVEAEDAEGKANAKLIACAPEMLVVLEQIRDMVGGESEDPDRDIARMQDLASAMADKARGISRQNDQAEVPR
jgi:hypothetical protein